MMRTLNRHIGLEPKQHRAKDLPLHIYRHKGGYRVEVQRGKVRMRGYSRDLAVAVKLKAQFERAAGPAAPSHPSNTGIEGICETVKWVRYRPRNCFRVRLNDLNPRLPQARTVYYGGRRTRAEALRKARAMRLAAGHQGEAAEQGRAE